MPPKRLTVRTLQGDIAVQLVQRKQKGPWWWRASINGRDFFRSTKTADQESARHAVHREVYRAASA